MMRGLMHVLLVLAVAGGVSACGNKGKLKSPTQIQVQAEKKARKQAKNPKDTSPTPVPDAPVPAVVQENMPDEHMSVATPSNDVAKY